MYEEAYTLSKRGIDDLAILLMGVLKEWNQRIRC
jgi:hypothetical protein